MGSPDSDSDAGSNEKPQHKVRITKPFYLGVYEVTQAEYEKVMVENPSYDKRATNPVEMVSWAEATEFCKRLSATEGKAYHLPTEAEWEYACRAGTTTQYSFGDDEVSLGEYAWYTNNATMKTHAVGEKKGNAWGLHDMHGNVWEWCQDWYAGDYYANSPTDDPQGPSSGASYRVVRGGCWIDSAWSSRSAFRYRIEARNRYERLGFRVAAVPPGGQPSSSGMIRGAEKPQPDAKAATEKAVAAQKECSQRLRLPVEITNSIDMKLKLIPAGEFLMGSPESEEGHRDNQHQHPVRITKSFYLGVYEVTQSGWKEVMGTEPWSGRPYVKEGSEYPATHISWDDAVKFCKKLSGKEGRTYRLPTEAEWEYACRADSKTPYSFGVESSELGTHAWYGGNDGNCKDEEHAHEVGRKRANAFGLYDMHGNVWEWCQDWYSRDYYRDSPTDDPPGPEQASSRVVRGGCWRSDAWFCRAASRLGFRPQSRWSDLGFRVAAVPPGK
jgi:formylglycine-generating enzyme required for sulfatase activity